MCLVAVKQPYILQIMHDDDAPNPREDYSNFGKMICWHRRYNLGDKPNHENPREFLEQLVMDSVPAEDIVDYVRNGNTKDVRLNYNRSSGEWTVTSYYPQFDKWFTECIFDGKLEDGMEELAECIVVGLNMQDLMANAKRKNVILDLNLYDHSILRMSTSSFIGRAHHAEWDSGQVGWVYASHDDIEEEYGSVTPETLEKAENLLRAEVETYDCYLSNQCYGFRLYRDGVEEDSCWGFLGYLDDLKKDIAGYLPEEYRSLVDNMEDIEDRDFDDYLYSESAEEMEVMG